MAYSTITLNQALADLGRRLYDPNGIFWTSTEKTRYLKEAIRCLSSSANYYRDSFTFPTVANQWWYDLTSVSGSLRPFTVTDVDLYDIIENHFLEPDTGATWTGSAQFTIDDLLQAVQPRRDQLLYDTGCTLNRRTQSASGLTTVLDDKVIDVRRMAWMPNSGPYVNAPLWPDDHWGINAFEPSRSSTGQPQVYTRSTEPPLTLVTDIAPAVSGNYELLTVESGALLLTGSPTILIVPDDWTWVIKFGAMADLLNRESAAKDTVRAKYCQQRYDQGVALMKNSPALLAASIGSNELGIDAAQYVDDYRPLWQAEAASMPDLIAIAGLNYIACAPKPSGVISIDTIVLRNAPFPATGGDFLQIGREDYDAVLDYAQHIASFKQGGAEFLSTIPLLQNFITHVARYNSKLNELGEFTDVIYGQSQLQSQANPVTTMDIGGDGNGGQGG